MLKGMGGLSSGRPAGLVLIGVFGITTLALSAEKMDPPWKSGILWPEPQVIDPGPPGGVPSDAIVLFDGKDLSQWTGGPWEVRDGYAICSQGDIKTKQSFGDCQLHLEWAAPTEIKGNGQGRGNSGVFLMGLYELQVLDSYDNQTYYDGQCGSIYKQSPPLVNVCRKPGEWQTYDVIFRAPSLDIQGKLLKPAYITVLQNGVLIQDHFEIVGETNYRKPPFYRHTESKLPLRLQWHGHPVRYRNIWIRELGDTREDLLKPLRERLSGKTAASRPN